MIRTHEKFWNRETIKHWGALYGVIRCQDQPARGPIVVRTTNCLEVAAGSEPAMGRSRKKDAKTQGGLPFRDVSVADCRSLQSSPPKLHLPVGGLTSDTTGAVARNRLRIELLGAQRETQSFEPRARQYFICRPAGRGFRKVVKAPRTRRTFDSQHSPTVKQSHILRSRREMSSNISSRFFSSEISSCNFAMHTNCGVQAIGDFHATKPAGERQAVSRLACAAPIMHFDGKYLSRFPPRSRNSTSRTARAGLNRLQAVT